MILGLTEPSNGSATVQGKRYRNLKSPHGSVGAVLESNDFHPARSGRDHLRILAAQSAVDASRVWDCLQRKSRCRSKARGPRPPTGLLPHRPPGCRRRWASGVEAAYARTERLSTEIPPLLSGVLP